MLLFYETQTSYIDRCFILYCIYYHSNAVAQCLLTKLFVLGIYNVRHAITNIKSTYRFDFAILPFDNKHTKWSSNEIFLRIARAGRKKRRWNSASTRPNKSTIKFSRFFFYADWIQFFRISLLVTSPEFQFSICVFEICAVVSGVWCVCVHKM